MKTHLNSEGCTGSLRCVVIKDYRAIFTDLSQGVFNGTILLGKPWAYTGGASYAIYNAVGEGKRKFDLSPIMLRKAQKNPVEVRGMENANIKDAVALIALAAELEQSMEDGSEVWDEISVSERLLEYRMKQKLFKVRFVYSNPLHHVLR